MKSKIIPFILFCTLVVISSCKGCNGCIGCDEFSCSSKDVIEKAVDKTKDMLESDNLEKNIDKAKKVYKKIK